MLNRRYRKGKLQLDVSDQPRCHNGTSADSSACCVCRCGKGGLSSSSPVPTGVLDASEGALQDAGTLVLCFRAPHLCGCASLSSARHAFYHMSTIRGPANSATDINDRSHGARGPTLGRQGEEHALQWGSPRITRGVCTPPATRELTLASRRGAR